MANVLTTQLLIDEERNVVVNIQGFLDTSDLAATTVLNPATLSARIPAATQLNIRKIEFAVEDLLVVSILFDATADVVAFQCVGRGEVNFCDVGGLNNNAGAGKTGQIQISTQGWSVGGLLSFNIVLYCNKQS